MLTSKIRMANINRKGDVDGKSQKTVNSLNKKVYNPDKAEAYWLGQFSDTVFEAFTFIDSQDSDVESMDYDLKQIKLGEDKVFSVFLKEVKKLLEEWTF